MHERPSGSTSRKATTSRHDCGKLTSDPVVPARGGAINRLPERDEVADTKVLLGTAGDDSGSTYYAHAPITEAVVEFRVTQRPTLTLDELNSLKAGEEVGYPLVAPRFDLKGEFELTDVAVSTSAQRIQTGYVFSRSDRTQIFQARLDGFAFSWLPPYDSWEPFAAEALRLWRRYVAVARPISVDRIGVRYVNRIDIPENSVEIKDYLNVWPEIPVNMPQILQGYFLQLGVSLKEFDAAVTINSTIVAPPSEFGTSLILDLDTYTNTQLLPGKEEFDQAVVNRLRSLRRAKNFVFEASITDETRRLIS